MCSTCTEEKLTVNYVNNLAKMKTLVDQIDGESFLLTGDNAHYISIVEKMNAKQINENVLKPIIEEIEQNAEYRKNDIERKIRRFQSDIDDYKRAIVNSTKQLLQTMELLNQIEEPNAKMAKKIVEDLKMLNNHPKIKEIVLNKNNLFILTNKIDIYLDDKTYSGAEYIIVINIHNGSVRFNSTNRRKSHWGVECPHPHVDGRNGRPCLGNIETSIADLVARREYTILTYLLIDFLESVNVNDPAGKHIKHWDLIDPNTMEILEAGQHITTITLDCGCDVEEDEDRYSCEECGSEFCETGECGVYVTNRYEDRYVCRNCIDNHYTFSEVVDEYIHENNWDSELHEYSEED